MPKVETANPEKTVATVETPTKVTVDENQKNKELAFRLLWQAQRLVKGATFMDIREHMPTIRNWVGAERAEKLELSWRSGVPLVE